MILIYIAIFIFLVYIYLTWNFNYWTKQGVPAPKATVLLGDLPNGLLRKQNVAYDMDKIYKDFKGKTPFVGIIQMRDPRLFLIEPEVIKDVFIRKFHHFRNNEFSEMIDTEKDPLLAMNPFFLTDDAWKEKRAEITPAFTVNRLKSLYPLIQDVAKRMIKYIHQELPKKEPFDARELSAKFTTDVVSNCIFAVDAQSFTKENPEIREMGRKILTPSLLMIFKIFILASVPLLRGLMKVTFIQPDMQAFFVDLMRQALKYRKDNNVQREDWLDYLIQLQKKKNLSELEMASHTISFFSDGFETSSIAMSHVLYELSKNKRVQDKLREEINKHCDENGQISYESLLDMPYLDQVFHEGLRLHPALVAPTRLCSEDITLEFDGKKAHVEKGTNVIVPILNIHYDPEYYTEPEQFYPERFDDGAMKSYVDRCVLMPFGGGPRVCLGMRFALVQSKAGLATLIRNFEVTLNKRTPDPLVIDPNEILNVKTGKLWLDFKPLHKS